MKHIVVTGANRGLGLAYTDVLLARGDHVVATCRPDANTDALRALTTARAGKLTICELDVRASEALPSLIGTIQQHTQSIDVLINNAGILTDHETIKNVHKDALVENYLVNAVAPIMLTQHLLPLIQQGHDPVIVNITSSFASISRKTATMPARYSYAMSKAALNMFTKTLAGELAPLGITVVAIHPGWVRTGIGGPEARFSPEEAARAVMQTIDQLTLARTGSYLTWDGQDIAW